MSFKKISLALAMVASMTSGLAVEALAETSKQEKIADLVRELGYGGAIQRYKSYVIRGEDEYRVGAHDAFSNAQNIIAALRETDLSGDESGALDSIEGAVGSYQNALDAVHKMVEEDYDVGDVVSMANGKLKIDDTSALAALDTLRAGYQWNEVQELQFVLGYGGAIHRLKNFLLQGEKQYEDEAKDDFDRALELVEKIGAMDLNDEEQAALAAIKKTIIDYEKGMKTAEKTALYVKKAKAKSVIGMAIHQADKKIKVDDSAALAGLALLEKKFAGLVAD